MSQASVSLIEEIFAPEGLLSMALSHFEKREGQVAMSREIWEAFESKTSALIEAGTGIGKTIAYLIPALLFSHRTGDTIVISTYTLALQQQLIEKDIPTLMNALGLSLSVALGKGMGNYLCLRHLQEKRLSLIDGDGYQELCTFASDSKEGSRSEFLLSDEIWEKVKADKNSCHFSHCPHYRDCFFFKARKKLIDANVIIVNHHLLMADLMARKERGEEGAILPAYRHLVIDEAHHLEEVARSALSARFDPREVLGALAHVHSETHPETSRFKTLKGELTDLADSGTMQQLSLHLPAERRKLVELLREMTDTCAFMLEGRFSYRVDGDKEELLPSLNSLKEQIKRYGSSLIALEKEIRALPIDEQNGKIEGALIDISKLSTNLEKWAEMLEEFASESTPKQVRFLKRDASVPELIQAELEIGEMLKEHLFSQLDTAVLCSATLCIEGNFSHLTKQVGASGKESIYPSPFDFKERALMCVPTDLPQPGERDFPLAAADMIHRSIQASGGGAFVLFTSYEMLSACKKALPAHEFPIFEQGSMSRSELLKDFAASGNGVLFGTDSFWERVDVPGHALRLVIITRLPFPVPSDPIVEARGEWLKSQGRNAFGEDSLPRAALKLKQGFGRLIRTASDRGCVVCLDSRLVNRSYGKRLLASLPECRLSIGSKSQIISELDLFYRIGA